MEKRSTERVPANLDTRFLYDDMFYSGRILNLSENGMFISTMKYVPSESKFLVVIRIKNEIYKMPAKVKRVTRRNTYSDGIGVELIEPDEEYLKYLKELRVAV